MMQDSRLDVLARGWRGPLLAAAVALLAGLPGAFAMPALDRDESRFAEATAQMLQTRDFVSINYQDQPRQKKPIAIHWLQAASVEAFSSVEAHQIWAYRIPSLLGAMLAAAACVWGAAAFFPPGTSLIAGAILGACFLLSTEAGIGKTDAVLCGAVTLAMAAFARIYGAAQPQGAPAGWRTRLLLWLGLSLATLDKGPIGPMVAGLAGVALWGWDRRAPWLGKLGWTWGLILFAAIVGPWTVAITIRTDGQFWIHAIGGDLTPKLAGGHEGHGAPPGLHVLAAPLLLFPSAFLLPAALVEGWKARLQPGVRFALCWLAPSWLVFELVPTKLVHYTLPLYGALAWLGAYALTRPWGARTRWAGVGLSLLAGVALAAAFAAAGARYGASDVAVFVVVTAALALVAGAAGALAAWRPRWVALAATLGLGVAAHAAAVAGIAPRLQPLWLSKRVVALLDRAGLNPRAGLTPGPVSVVGYAEPSLVFALGAKTQLTDVDGGAEAVSEGRPVIVEGRADAAFRTTLDDDGLKATPAGAVSGVDYSTGKAELLTLYRPDSPPPDESDDSGARSSDADASGSAHATPAATPPPA